MLSRVKPMSDFVISSLLLFNDEPYNSGNSSQNDGLDKSCRIVCKSGTITGLRTIFECYRLLLIIDVFVCGYKRIVCYGCRVAISICCCLFRNIEELLIYNNFLRFASIFAAFSKVDSCGIKLKRDLNSSITLSRCKFSRCNNCISV